MMTRHRLTAPKTAWLAARNFSQVSDDDEADCEVATWFARASQIAGDAKMPQKAPAQSCRNSSSDTLPCTVAAALHFPAHLSKRTPQNKNNVVLTFAQSGHVTKKGPTEALTPSTSGWHTRDICLCGADCVAASIGCMQIRRDINALP